jgi:capsular polysaccharide transport system permease protein
MAAAITDQEGGEEKEKGLFEALRIQNNIIGKLILHDIRKRYKRDKIGLAWAFLVPCTHVLMWWTVMTFIRMRHERLGMAPILIVCSGMVPMFQFRVPATLLGVCVNSGRALLRYPLVRPIDIILARFIVEGLIILAVGIFVFTVLILLGYAPLPRDPLGLFPPISALLAMGLSFGGLSAVASPLSYWFSISFKIILRLIYYTSGVFFLGNTLPFPLQGWILLNPVYHCVELFRTAYFSNFRNDYVTIWYPVCWVVVCSLLALAVERVKYSKSFAEWEGIHFTKEGDQRVDGMT